MPKPAFETFPVMLTPVFDDAHAGAGRATRIVTGSPERAKEARQVIAEQVVPRAKDMPGLKNAYWMADEATGKVVAVILFETEADLVASRERPRSIGQEPRRHDPVGRGVRGHRAGLTRSGSRENGFVGLSPCRM